MTKAKKDFTTADRNKYSGIIGGIDTIDTKNITNIENTENIRNIQNTRHYNRLDPRKAAPKEYRFTARMPGEYARKSTFFKRKIMMKDSDDIG